MKFLILALILALSIQGSYQLDSTVTSTTTLTEVLVASSPNECSVLIYKCVVDKLENNGDTNSLASATSLTFEWSILDNASANKLATTPAQNYEQIDTIDLASASQIGESYLIVHPGTLTDASNAHTVKCKQIQKLADGTTPTTGGTDEATKQVTITAKDANTTCTTGPVIEIDEYPGANSACSLKAFIDGGNADTDKMFVHGAGSTMTQFTAGPAALPTITENTKAYIIGQKSGNKVETLYVHTFVASECGLTITDVSQSTDRCALQIVSLEVDKVATATVFEAKVDVLKGDTTPALLAKDTDYYVLETTSSAAATKVKFNVIVQPSKFLSEKDATFTIGVKQSTASAMLGTIIRRSVLTITMDASTSCTNVGTEMTADYGDECADYTITGSDAGAWKYYGKEDVGTLPASGGTESATFATTKPGFYVNTVSANAFDFKNLAAAPGACVQVKATSALDRCADIVLECYSDDANATFAWSATNIDLSNITRDAKQLTLPANTLTDNTAQTVKCTLGNGSDEKEFDFTPVDTSCSGGGGGGSTPSTTTEDSQILSVLVLALLVFLL